MRKKRNKCTTCAKWLKTAAHVQGVGLVSFFSCLGQYLSRADGRMDRAGIMRYDRLRSRGFYINLWERMNEHGVVVI